MSPLSDRATPQQPLPLSSLAAILGFDSTPYSLSLRRAVPPCRKLFSLLTFNLLAFNVLRHLTSFFSATSALFSAMASTQIPCFQRVAHSFPSHGGGGQRMNVRSIRASDEGCESRGTSGSRGTSPTVSPLVHPSGGSLATSSKVTT